MPKTFRFQKKIIHHAENQGRSLNEERRSIDVKTKVTEMLEFSSRDGKSAIVRELQ